MRYCLVGLLLSGCLAIDFDPPQVVSGPRILAIDSTPPESAVGEDVVFEALVVDENGTNLAEDPDVELRFMVCLSVASIFSAAGLGSSVDLDDNCGEGGEDLVRLEQGGDLPAGAARFRGAAVLELIAELMGGGGGGPPPGVDPELLATLAAIIEVGVPLRMRLEVWRDGEEILTGFKRFAITTRQMPTTNPPPPRFAVDGVWLTARGDDPRRCVPEEEGEIPVVAAGAEEVPFAPEENDEDWLEEYPVIDLEGNVLVYEEGAYYSWFSTQGQFASDITNRPDRDNTWLAPEEPGTYPMWLVVRDGHLGMSWCRADIQVE
jgi:hypothetical protein